MPLSQSNRSGFETLPSLWLIPRLACLNPTVVVLKPAHPRVALRVRMQSQSNRSGFETHLLPHRQRLKTLSQSNRSGFETSLTRRSIIKVQSLNPTVVVLKPPPPAPSQHRDSRLNPIVVVLKLSFPVWISSLLSLSQSNRSGFETAPGGLPPLRGSRSQSNRSGFETSPYFSQSSSATAVSIQP